MKEFVLTQSYATIDEMINSEELDVCRAELERCEIEFYAIISRIGNRYDIFGNKINNFVQNPYLLCQAPVCEQQEAIQNVVAPVAVEIEEKKEEETDMKYAEIEALIDAKIEKAVAEVKAEYELKISTYEYDIGVRETEHAEEIAKLKEQHAIELENAKEQAKAELIAKLSA